MTKPMKVELLEHDPQWGELARKERARLMSALNELVVDVHHIGSTAIPGMRAKPVIDLLVEVSDLSAFEERRGVLEGLGYAWWGENGVSSRRFCTLDDAKSGSRLIHLHAFVRASPDVTRHLAYRDLMIEEPALAYEYERMKIECQRRHPDDSNAYSICKSPWIKAVEARAIKSGVRTNR